MSKRHRADRAEAGPQGRQRALTVPAQRGVSEEDVERARVAALEDWLEGRLDAEGLAEVWAVQPGDLVPGVDDVDDDQADDDGAGFRAAYATAAAAALGYSTGDVRHVLLQLVEQRERLDLALVASVNRARLDGWSWDDLASVLGVTRQSAHRRFRDAAVEAAGLVTARS